MEINEVIDNLTAWAQENLCNNTELLKPPAKSGDMSSDYELVTPKAFPLYVPTKDLKGQLPPDVSFQLPSICVQLVKGSDDMAQNERSIELRLSFSAYRPGTFTEDKEGNVVFERNSDGWKDLWLWVSKSINKLQTDMYIEGVRIEKTTPITYGHFQIDENLVEAYPLWYAWINLTVTCGIKAKHNTYNEYL